MAVLGLADVAARASGFRRLAARRVGKDAILVNDLPRLPGDGHFGGRGRQGPARAVRPSGRAGRPNLSTAVAGGSSIGASGPMPDRSWGTRDDATTAKTSRDSAWGPGATSPSRGFTVDLGLSLVREKRSAATDACRQTRWQGCHSGQAPAFRVIPQPAFRRSRATPPAILGCKNRCPLHVGILATAFVTSRGGTFVGPIGALAKDRPAGLSLQGSLRTGHRSVAVDLLARPPRSKRAPPVRSCSRRAAGSAVDPLVAVFATYGRTPVVDTDDRAARDGNQQSSAPSTVD
jgi:hypothetical protein